MAEKRYGETGSSHADLRDQFALQLAGHVFEVIRLDPRLNAEMVYDYAEALVEEREKRLAVDALARKTKE
jgi:hypothetical protein